MIFSLDVFWLHCHLASQNWKHYCTDRELWHILNSQSGNLSQSNQPPRSTQPGHPFVGRLDEYRSKGGDALRLGVKADMVLFSGNTVWSISERVRGVCVDALYKSTYTLLFTLLYQSLTFSCTIQFMLWLCQCHCSIFWNSIDFMKMTVILYVDERRLFDTMSLRITSECTVIHTLSLLCRLYSWYSVYLWRVYMWNQVLPPLRTGDNLRVHDLPYNLPDCSTNVHKKSFVVRSLYGFI